MFRTILAVLTFAALVACSSQAPAQSVPLQGGPWTIAHAPMYSNSGNSQPVIQDSGPAGGGAAGLGMSEGLYVARGTGTPPYVGQGTGPSGTNWCDYDAPITNATGYHYLCLSPNVDGAGLIIYGAGGAAAQQPLNINLNGTTYTFPFALSGIVGPATSVVGDLVCWNNVTGTLVSDCGPHTPILHDNLTGTGTNQATALLVNTDIDAFTTIGSGTGARLPTLDANGNAIAAGFTLEIITAGANNLLVYPPVGHSINGAGANVAVTIFSTGDVHFIYRGSSAWYAR